MQKALWFSVFSPEESDMTHGEWKKKNVIIGDADEIVSHTMHYSHYYIALFHPRMWALILHEHRYTWGQYVFVFYRNEARMHYIEKHYILTPFIFWTVE